MRVTNFRKVWHDEHDDGTHEIVMVLGNIDMPTPYWVGYGRFKTDMYDKADHEWAMNSFGLHLLPKGCVVSDAALAECLFECNMADFDVWCYDTEAEALAKAEELVGE